MDISFQVEHRTLLSRMDWSLILIVLTLNFVGLVNLYSATHGPHSQDVANLFISQIIWLGAGWSIFFILTLVDYQNLLRLAYPIYFLNLIALIFVTFFGTTALGAQRWIDLGFFRYQPSETMKLALVLVLAKNLSRYSVNGPGLGFKSLVIPILLILLPFGLVVEQPDLGTGLMLMAIGGGILVFMKIRKMILMGVIALGIIAIPIAWNYVLRDYQRDRILNFLSPTRDPRGSGYNSIQSKIAIGSGMLVGKGFRKGTQSQLEFLPERHTDFIFSVLSEEHGFIGSFLTVCLFVALFVVAVRIIDNARDKFGAILVVGVVAYIFFHMTINIGMVIGLLPIVGVPLPLLSYGGSSMLTTMAGLGLVSSVSFRRYLF